MRTCARTEKHQSNMIISSIISAFHRKHSIFRYNAQTRSDFSQYSERFRRRRSALLRFALREKTKCIDNAHTREYRCSNNNSRNIPELCQQPRLQAISDTLRCNDNKRDVAHSRRGTSDHFSDCETTLTPWKRSSFIGPDEMPDLLFFVGIRSFILNVEERRLDWISRITGRRKDMWRKPRKILGSFKMLFRLLYTNMWTLICKQQLRKNTGLPAQNWKSGKW